MDDERQSEYTYDPKSKRFRGPDGRYVAASEVLSLRNQIIAAKTSRTTTLVNSLYDGKISPGTFVLRMRQEIKSATMMEYMLGRGGIHMLTQSDYGRIGSMLKVQYGYLNTFTRQIVDGKVTRDRAITRAGMYIDTTRAAYERSRAVAYNVTLPDYPGLHPNCFVPGTEVDARGVNAAYRHYYNGEVVEVTTASGKNFTVTPNHPIATTGGWVAAGNLDLSDKLIQARFLEGVAIGDPEKDNGVPTISEVFDALEESCLNGRPVRATVDFHGHIANSYINIVDTDSLLVDTVHPAIAKMVENTKFTVPDIVRNRQAPIKGLTERLNTLSNGDLRFSGSDPAPRGSVGSGDSSLTLLGRVGGGADLPGAGQVANADTTAHEHLGNGGASNTETLGNRYGAFAGLIKGDNLSGIRGVIPTSAGRGVASLNADRPEPSPDRPTVAAHGAGDPVDTHSILIEADDIVSINIKSYAGHVYNLSTANGWYIANGLIVHNCACYWELAQEGNDVHAYWNIASANPCPDCEDRESRWNPLVIEGPK